MTKNYTETNVGLRLTWDLYCFLYNMLPAKRGQAFSTFSATSKTRFFGSLFRERT